MSCYGAWGIKQVPRAVKIRRTFSESVLRIISKEMSLLCSCCAEQHSFFLKERYALMVPASIVVRDSVSSLKL